MSVEALSAVLHHSRAGGTDKLVLIGVANHAGDGGAWPSVETLARYANVSERSVQRSIGKLVGLGELAVQRQAGGVADMPAWSRPNRYDVLVSCPATCDRTPAHRPRTDLGITDPELGIKGVTPVSPGDASVTGGGDAGVTLTIPINPDVTVGGSVTGPRASGPAVDSRPCLTCGRGQPACDQAQRRLDHDDRHAYRPRGQA